MHLLENAIGRGQQETSKSATGHNSDRKVKLKVTNVGILSLSVVLRCALHISYRPRLPGGQYLC